MVQMHLKCKRVAQFIIKIQHLTCQQSQKRRKCSNIEIGEHTLYAMQQLENSKSKSELFLAHICQVSYQLQIH